MNIPHIAPSNVIFPSIIPVAFKTKPSKTKVSKDLNITDLELSISNRIGLNVEIKNKKNNKGKIVFEYKGLDQLNKIIEIIKNNY